MRVEMNLDVQHCHDDMDTKIAEFKQDSDKMNELNLFLDNVLDEAQKSAETKLQSKMEEERPKNAYKKPRLAAKGSFCGSNHARYAPVCVLCIYHAFCIMNISVLVSLVVCFCAQYLLQLASAAMTLKQLTNSMDMMRQACAPKFKVAEEELHALRKSMFPGDPHKELKCYTMCIAQMAGTMTKKGDISFPKTMAQIEAMLPPEMKAKAKEALTHCKDIQASYKDPCDKAYFSAKCAADFTPDTFMFP